MLFVAARRGVAHRTPARVIESTYFMGIHQEDSYYGTVRAIDANIGVLVVGDMIFHDMPPFASHHSEL